MKSRLIFLFLSVLIILLLCSNPAFAINGTPHIIYGKVFNADGTTPDNNSLETHAYIINRPNEILGKTSVGCGYELGSILDGWLWFEAGNYITPWAFDEIIRIIAINTLLQETGVVDLFLDSSGNQHIPDLYLAYGDHVGPIASNVMVDDTSHAFIPEGTESIILTAELDDTISGNSNIQVAEYFVDTDPGYGAGTALEPIDGLFDSPYEEMTVSVDISLWTEGSTHTIHVRGQDSVGNWGTAHSASVEVTPATYQFLGFLPPIENEGNSIFNIGRTVPVKFQLKDESGIFAFGGTARLTLQEYVEDMPVGEPLDATPSGDANTGNEFRYDTVDNLYIYNLDTKPLSVGKWNLIVTIEDGDRYEIFIQLR
ncbi:MAG: hypothetical protein A2Y81_05575 [Nitrospirae bacterium RBG_13_43_8]|nr:MAG: hypothetical protein A2Y81_05575 [Nitrospirae bacterium RBG_13_43_8]